MLVHPSNHMSSTPNDYVDLELESCLRRISGYILGFKNLIAESIYPLASDKKEFRKIAELFLQNDGSFDDKAKNCLSDILANKKARGVLEMSCSLHFQGVKQRREVGVSLVPDISLYAQCCVQSS